MPLYAFKCSTCDAPVVRVVCSNQKLKELSPKECKACGAPMTRAPKPPTSSVVETLDNGLMAKRLERPSDAQRLYYDRAHKDPQEDK